MACIEPHIADPRPCHDALLHLAPRLSDATGDFLHRLDDAWMVGPAQIAETLRKIVWANPVEIGLPWHINRLEAFGPPRKRRRADNARYPLERLRASKQRADQVSQRNGKEFGAG